MIKFKTLLLTSLSICTICSAGNRFVEMGIPSPNREWSSKDYEQAASILSSEKISLPTLKTEDGAQILSRILNIQNLNLALNQTLPLDQRMNEALVIQGTANSIFKRYIADQNSGKGNFHTEIAQQSAFTLKEFTIILDLVDEFIPTIIRDDKYEIRMAGLRKLKGNMEYIFSAAEYSLKEKDFYSSEDLSLLLKAMSEELPSLKRAFSEDFTSEMKQRLKAQLDQFDDPNDLKMINIMIENSSQPGV